MKRSHNSAAPRPMKRAAFAHRERIEAREVTKAIAKADRAREMRTKSLKMTPIRKAARPGLHHGPAGCIQLRPGHLRYVRKRQSAKDN